MDFIHKILNLIFPPITIIFLILILPFYLTFKFLSFLKRSIQSENVTGKVVLITGASSGIGEQLAYEYAKKGACLALVARREDRLQSVAKNARDFGSPDVIVVCADVSKLEDCKRFVDETIEHFGKLDHLVNNAGIVQVCAFQNYKQISDSNQVMDINFWGSANGTYFAIPYLKKSKGKIIVICSVTEWLPLPCTSLYNASKAAQRNLYETMRIEFGSSIGITLVNPGFIHSEMTQHEIQQKALKYVPFISTEGCAKAILKSACRGDTFLSDPFWMRVLFLLKELYPELYNWLTVVWLNRFPELLKSES